MTRSIQLSLAITLALSVSVFGVEFAQDAQVGDFARFTLKDGVIYQGDLLELTDTRVILETKDGKLVLLRDAVVKIEVIPRRGEKVCVMMTSDTAYEGEWLGEDETRIYITTGILGRDFLDQFTFVAFSKKLGGKVFITDEDIQLTP